MRAPGFWYAPPGPAAAALAPLGVLYAAGGRLRRRLARPWRAPVPVVCLGNLVAGGAGKTPAALAVMERLAARGLAAHFLSRGHGGSLRGPVRVDPARHTAAEVGDEPLLLAGTAPAWVSRDRAAGARAAAAAGAAAIVMDDGFQNPGLAKDLSLLVVDGGAGFGNGRVIPAGPLREPLADGLARAQAVLLVGDDRAGAGAALAGRLPLLRARLVPDAAAVTALAGRPCLAFAGIGRPAKFFDTCREAGLELAGAVPFPDHHPYRESEVAALLERARRLGATAVTTEKDAVRLPGPLRGEVAVLPARLRLEEEGALDALLDGVMRRHGEA
ncbi:MAG TPA: tetraacyldisaccharide 4'-kinase [Azospirillaceae bacterium]|nr:tetraacyldisaccharide 4'-kinase [Azospirillaceae bacterium]